MSTQTDQIIKTSQRPCPACKEHTEQEKRIVDGKVVWTCKACGHQHTPVAKS